MTDVHNSTPAVAPAEEVPPFPTRFELRTDERSADGLCRIVVEQIDLALWHAQNVDVGDEHVHGVRRTTKRLRAVLRLVRDGIGEDSYRHHNRALRDIARELSSERSATVRIETLKTLGEGSAPLAESTNAIHDVLVADADRLRTRMLEGSWLVDSVIDPLERTRADLDTLTLPSALVPTTVGLERTYRRGRRGMGRAYVEGSTSRFHEWRKRVKYLRHQMEVLAAAQPETTPTFAVSLEELGDGLGLDHDLADLGSVLSRPMDATSFPTAEGALLNTIARRREELQAELHPMGERLYARTPHDFVRDMTAHWTERASEAPSAGGQTKVPETGVE
jgi:CHAD domain-containing protein